MKDHNGHAPHGANGYEQSQQPPHIQPHTQNYQAQPHQIFGKHNGDGSPITAEMGNIPDGMHTDTTALLDSLEGDPSETNEAKRRRIARACDMCRKKKIKCDGKLPSCSHCVNYKTECVFTQVEKKRNPPKGAKYIEGLENRLGRMENLLRMSGLLTGEGEGEDLGMLEERLKGRSVSVQSGSMPASPTHSQATGIGSRVRETPDSSSESNQHTPITSHNPTDGREQTRSGQKTPEEVEALSDMMCSLVTNNQGESKYIGSSSGFSIFSPKGIAWVSEKTGDTSFQDMIHRGTIDDTKWVYWKPEIFGDIFSRPIYQSLPPKNETLSLLKDYFENFNCMFPLFHQPTFMHLVEMQYSDAPYEGSGWWASLNCALAIAHRLRVMSNLVDEHEDDKAWLYMKNAMAVFTELTMRNTDLLSVQALLGMALFMQGTPNPQPSFLLVAAAIRLSHSIGLHKRGSGFNLNAVEVEQRKRVFWIAYMLDKDLCLRSGRPPAQDDDDINVELPSPDPEDNIGNIPLSDGKGKVNLFRLMCEFAVIEGLVYKSLYSSKSSKQSDGELLNTIGALDRTLEEWKDSIPIDFRPEHEIKANHTPMILHIVVLHFAYYNCLTTIHRMAVHHGYWTSRLSDFAIQGLNSRPLNPRVFSSAALCVQAARASIHLIKYVPQGDYSCVWLILYFPVSALMTLFGNILQNPQDPRARSDVRLMNLVVTFLSNLSAEEENAGVKRMLGVCTEFERIAKAVIDRSEKESGKRKRRATAADGEALPRISTTRPPPVTPVMGHTNGPVFPTQNSPAYRSITTTPDNRPAFLDSDTTAMLDQTIPPSSSRGQPLQYNQQFLAENLNTLGAEFNVDMANNLTSFGDMSRYLQPSVNNLGMGNGMGMNGEGVYVPQDMFAMPMAMDWDWADMTGGQYPGFENAAYDNQNQNNQHGYGGQGQ